MELTAAQMRALDEMVDQRMREAGESFDQAAVHVLESLRAVAQREQDDARADSACSEH